MQQRQIKFRAWDKIEARMWPVTLINFEAEVASLEGFVGEEMAVVTDGDGGVLATGRRRNKPLSLLILEQFTGLLDKNGIEIFEGDILQHEKYTSGVYVAEWDGEMACFIAKSQRSDFEGFISGMVGCYVVGNIHENPDLIESGAKQQEA